MKPFDLIDVPAFPKKLHRSISFGDITSPPSRMGKRHRRKRVKTEKEKKKYRAREKPAG